MNFSLEAYTHVRRVKSALIFSYRLWGAKGRTDYNFLFVAEGFGGEDFCGGGGGVEGG